MPPSALAWRLRLGATSLALAALTFIARPGQTVGDTKADLVLAPGAFLERALHLWDPSGAFGQMQNQAYGYLFPMGPFFWLGNLASIEPWIIQRLWWSLLLVVAFLGMVKLCGALHLGSPAARLIGGVAYALSPRIMSVIGASSIEVWPSALAPWVLVPLVIGLRRGNTRYLAALSAVAVACVGGVNAAATFAVIPLGAIWLLMAAPSDRRRSLMIWWPACVALGTLWWLGPLLLLGRYSPPFLDFIESATTTTFAATAFDALRGTTNWIPYLDGTMVSGHALISNPTVIVNSTVLMVLGLWGIARRDNPVGRFMIASVAVGLIAVTLGHTGTNLGSGVVQDLLDGALSPLRNTHKFDPLIRVPMVLGVVHLISALSRRPAGEAGTVRRRSALATSGAMILAAAALLGSTVPAWTADLANRGAYSDVPAYWTDTTTWLNAQAADQNSLLLPGSSFGEYLWGSPRDEVVQPYLRGPWSVRNAVPLAPAGSIRMLDALEASFGSGLGSPALRDQLIRSGIRYLVVRHDLANDATYDPELVHSTLLTTPGVVLAQTFGPLVGSPPSQETDGGETVFVNAGRQSQHHAVEIFEVEGVDSSEAMVQPWGRTPVVVGSPQALLTQDGLFGSSTDTVLATDQGTSKPDGPVVLTDTDRLQEVAFGRVVANRSATLTGDGDFRIDRPVHDYVSSGGQRWKTVAELVGARRITASSSASDVTEPRIDPARQPWSAFDGDRSTRWTAGSSTTRAWLEIEFDEPTSVAGLRARLSRGQPDRDLRVMTDSGTETSAAQAGTETALGTPVGLTRMLRITGPSSGLEPLSFDEIEIPGVELSRPLRLPGLPSSWDAPDDIVLTAADGPAVCRNVDTVTRCAAGRDGLGEDGRTIDRSFSLPKEAAYAVGVSVHAQDSTGLTDHLSGDVRLRASSTGSSQAAAGLLATIDGDPQTGWIAALRDVTPQLDIDFGADRDLDELVLRTDPTLAASAPRRAQVTTDSGRRIEVRFDTDGRAELPDVTTSRLTVEITAAYVRSSLSFDGTGSGLPLGISEIEVSGGKKLSTGASTVRDLPCGSGPRVEIDGKRFETSLRTSRRAVLSRRTISTTVCELPGVQLAAGDHRITVQASAAFRPASVRLTKPGAAFADGAAARTTRLGRHRITVPQLPGDGQRLVALSQNVNGGWTAPPARPMTVNGWQQGWVSSDDELVARFGPARLYLGMLLVGLGAAIALLVAVVRLRRKAPDAEVSRPPRVRWRAVAATVLAVTATLAVGGPGGAACAAVATLAVVMLGRRWDVSWLASFGVLVAGTVYLMRPWTSPAGWAGSYDWVQWCVVASVAAAGGCVFDREIRRFFNRMLGRSTTR